MATGLCRSTEVTWGVHYSRRRGRESLSVPAAAPRARGDCALVADDGTEARGSRTQRGAVRHVLSVLADAKGLGKPGKDVSNSPESGS